MLRKLIVTLITTMMILFAFATMANAEDALLSENKRAWANSAESANPAKNLVDGDFSNNWAGNDGNYDKYVVIDLGAVYELSYSKIYPKQNSANQYRAYKYTIAVSSDGASFETVVDKSTNTMGEEYYTDDLSGVEGRYVKIHVTGEKDGKWVSFYEVQIYGDDTQLGLINCALGKNVDATDEQDEEGNVAQNLTDGSVNTYWAAEGENNSAIVDLGETFYINSAEFIPEGKRAYGYKIEGSYDGISYTLIADMPENASADVLKCRFTPVEVRYVRLTITDMPAGVNWINIKEFAVFGQKQGSDLYYADEGQGLSVSGDATEVEGVFRGTGSALAGKSMTFIMTVYDGNEMVAYKVESHFIPSYGEEFEETIRMTADEVGGSLASKVVEVFIWDNLENMKTIVAPVSFSVNSVNQ